MDERKILIVNLSRGLIGEDNAALLGALMVTKIQLGAMSRADIDQKDRIPFFLYVDEFQNFATDSFATILSEARKYALNLTVANQYIAQMSQSVRDAVFGNVGSIIAFRMGADDSRVMLKYFEPKFTDYDLVHMHNRHIVLNMTIEGEKVQAFSAATLDLPDQFADNSQAIIEHSRQQYSAARAGIETFMKDRYITPEQAFKQMQGGHETKREEKPAQLPQPKPEPHKEVLKSEDGAALNLGKLASDFDVSIERPKRKRRRNRHHNKESAVAPHSQPQPQSTDHGTFEQDTTINLR